MNYGILDYQTEIEVEKPILDDGNIFCYDCNDETELPDSIETLDAVSLWHNIVITEKTLARLNNCKVIVRIGVGYDNVDGKVAGALGIPLVNIPDYGTNDVADHAFALTLSAVRSLNKYTTAFLEKKCKGWSPHYGGEMRRLTDQTLGIIGMGRIGSAVALRAKAFGLNVVFYDPYIADGYDKTYHCQRVNTIHELMACSDIVSVHAPLTNETENLINDTILKNAKPDMILINTARGKIVNSDAVYDALRSGTLRFFAADVLWHEPPQEEDLLFGAFLHNDPVCKGKVLFTPHCAFYAKESRVEMRQKSAMQMKIGANGLSLKNCVNKEFLVNSRTPVL